MKPIVYRVYVPLACALIVVGGIVWAVNHQDQQPPDDRFKADLAESQKRYEDVHTNTLRMQSAVDAMSKGEVPPTKAQATIEQIAKEQDAGRK